jgi:hypothetical protein
LDLLGQSVVAAEAFARRKKIAESLPELHELVQTLASSPETT